MSSFSESVCGTKADFELFHIIFLSSVDYLHCLLFCNLMCDAVCDAVLTPSVFWLWMPNLLWLHEKTKSVLGRIMLLTFYSKWAKSKIVKLRILRKQSVASFGNPNLLIVKFCWKLIFLKLVFSDWHLLKLFSFFPIGIN